MRTYHVRRINNVGKRSYIVTMEVVAKEATEDILGLRPGKLTEHTYYGWDDLWEKS
ncbi:MAG: hypothetical protein HYZ81_27375 [Nitrospinae bacterium]|nr:hypothetical protein [Nitrospinota bacterium]